MGTNARGAHDAVDYQVRISVHDCMYYGDRADCTVRIVSRESRWYGDLKWPVGTLSVQRSTEC